MELSTYGGIPAPWKLENLVFYCHLPKSYFEGSGHPFVAALYEANAEQLSDNHVPLLLCTGTRHEEFTEALTFTTVLFDPYHKTQFRELLASWVLQSQAMQTCSYTLCMQIRDEGRLQDPVLPPPGVSKLQTIRIRYPSLVVSITGAQGYGPISPYMLDNPWIKANYDKAPPDETLFK